MITREEVLRRGAEVGRSVMRFVGLNRSPEDIAREARLAAVYNQVEEWFAGTGEIVQIREALPIEVRGFPEGLGLSFDWRRQVISLTLTGEEGGVGERRFNLWKLGVLRELDPSRRNDSPGSRYAEKDVIAAVTQAQKRYFSVKES